MLLPDQKSVRVITLPFKDPRIQTRPRRNVALFSGGGATACCLAFDSFHTKCETPYRRPHPNFCRLCCASHKGSELTFFMCSRCSLGVCACPPCAHRELALSEAVNKRSLFLALPPFAKTISWKYTARLFFLASRRAKTTEQLDFYFYFFCSMLEMHKSFQGGLSAAPTLCLKTVGRVPIVLVFLLCFCVFWFGRMRYGWGVRIEI